MLTSRKGFMGPCRITLPSLLLALHLVIMLLPDREPALDFFLVQGVCFPPLLSLPDEGVCGSAAVSLCLPVAGCCTDTSTGVGHKLNPGASSTTTLHWVEASHISAFGLLSTVWVPASRVSVDVFLHLHSSEIWVWGDENWAALLPVCWILLPEALAGKAKCSLTFWLSLEFICGFRNGVRGLGLVCLCCEPRFRFRLSAQQAWSMYEEAAWRQGSQHSSS